jgi:hypothetical protein
MKALKFFVLIIFLPNFEMLHQATYHSSISLAPYAIVSLLENHFSKFWSNVNVIYYGTTEVDDVLKLLTSENLQNMTFQIMNGSDQSWDGSLNRPSVVICDANQDIGSILGKLRFYTHPTDRYHHLIYSNSVDSISSLKSITLRGPMDSVNFLLKTSPDTLSLVTSFVNSEKMCRSNQLVDINQFNKSTMQWNNTQFYLDKFKNFYGCPLYVKLYKNEAEAIPDIITTLIIHVNATGYEAANKIDFHATTVTRDSIKPDHGSVISFPFITTSYVFIVPPGELYTPLEKMFKPFSFEVWIAILITLTIGFVSIWLISLCPLYVRHFVFSRLINTPSLNLISIFFNGGQHQVPTRNFSRFLLTLFIVWCLIIRTCYQSELFKHLQADDRKPPIATFNEIAERNFSVLVTGTKTTYWDDGIKTVILTNDTEEMVRTYAAEMGAPV